MFWSVLFPIYVVVLLLCFNLESPGLLGLAASEGGGNVKDQQALLEFKAKISNNQLGILRLWNNTVYYCQWYGVSCGSRRQRVTQLVLESQHLTGSISPSIGNFSFLKVLNLKNNSFIHEIPQEIGRLRRLRIYHLAANSIGGEIPRNKWENLTFVRERIIFGETFSTFKKLVGVIPETLGQLKRLTFFSVGLNNFSGTVPSSFCNLSNIRTFDIGDNYLEGSRGANDLNFPCSLTNARMLRRLSINENNFGGSTPECIGNLSTDLLHLNLDVNEISRTIPATIGNLINLEPLTIWNNQLSRAIPSVIGRLQQLQEFKAQNNSLSEGIPSSFGDLKMLISLNLSHNNLQGSIPSSLVVPYLPK
ncbi:putative receptor-like protein kinase At3g47110 [Durio zibethinus]|uniref:Receptor-like protein kinase At3g47110 n=1 Tax=Durio zibethinus TaxID=66656 RepID=A0A6P6A7B2_DURZI|nr:putative receptor-like protein kinase At3g47110 [Durio zibethinus]